MFHPIPPRNRPGMFPAWGSAIRTLSLWGFLAAVSWLAVIGFATVVTWFLPWI